MKTSPWTVISLGGSLIVPDLIDVKYLRRLESMLKPTAARRYAIVCGGGATSRRYIEAARRGGIRPAHDDLDSVGIRTIELNAEFVRMIFGRAADNKVFSRPSDFRTTKKSVVICGAAEPGHSSDFNAVSWAIKLRAERIVNLTNIDHVYDSDPRKNRRAKPIRRLSWETYLKIIGTKWTPGLNTPFDPIAAALAQKHHLSVAIVNGHRLLNVHQALAGKSFKGTTLHP